MPVRLPGCHARSNAALAEEEARQRSVELEARLGKELKAVENSLGLMQHKVGGCPRACVHACVCVRVCGHALLCVRGCAGVLERGRGWMCGKVCSTGDVQACLSVAEGQCEW